MATARVAGKRSPKLITPLQEFCYSRPQSNIHLNYLEYCNKNGGDGEMFSNILQAKSAIKKVNIYKHLLAFLEWSKKLEFSQLKDGCKLLNVISDKARSGEFTFNRKKLKEIIVETLLKTSEETTQRQTASVASRSKLICYFHFFTFLHVFLL